MTSSTSLIISGSSALVGSSSRMSFGFIASDRAIATRCCCPPESCAGIFFAWFATPTRSSSSMALASASFRDFFFTRIGAERHVLEHRLVREEVERLEHHADVGAQLGERGALFGQRDAVDRDRAGIDRLEPVDGPAEGRLARTRRPDDDDDLAAIDDRVDVVEHVQVAEVLLDVLDDDERFASTHTDVRSRWCGLGRLHNPQTRANRNRRTTCGAVVT